MNSEEHGGVGGSMLRLSVKARSGYTLLATAALAACAGKPAVFPTLDRKLPNGAVTDHVVIVSIDGLRPDAIATYKAPTLERLMGEGSYTLHAATILPSKTLPSHTSMLTGEPPSVHH